MTTTYTIPRGSLISYGDGYWIPVALPQPFVPNAPHAARGTIHGQTVILNPATAAYVYGETVGGMGVGR